jgi:hypothetical protein
LSGQSPKDYGAYKARALFYNATQRTIDGMTGLVFRKSPRVVLPSPVEPFAHDIDMAGTPLRIFAEELVTEVLTVGRAGLLVDHPPAREDVVTASQARDAGQRPYLKLYRAEDILDWRLGLRDSATVTTHLRLRERFSIPDPGDEFRSIPIEQIRVLDLDPDDFYRQRVFRGAKGRWDQVGESIKPLLDGRRLTYIPFMFIGPKDLRPSPSKPPLLDLVNVNLSHYRTTADFEHGAHFTGLPTPVISGHRLDEDECLSIGAGEAWVLASPEARAYFLEFSGEGLSTLVTSLERKERQMAAIGARMLAPEKSQAETAESLLIRRGGENSVLAALAQTISLGLTTALKILTRWAGVSDKVAFELNRDFLPTPMSAEALKAHIAAWQAGVLSEETLFEALQRGEVVAESLSFEAERARKGE